MIQNTPPQVTSPGQSPDEHHRSYDSGHADAGHSDDDLAGGGSPYGYRTSPDLDAAAPQLRSGDVKRLNRKALVFLAGIVALLIVGAVWMVGKATGGGEAAARPKQETVVIPELPRTQPRRPALEAPLPVMPESIPESMPELPPLPLASDAPAQSRLPGYSVPQHHGPTLMERRMLDVQAAQAPATTGTSQDPYVKAMLAGLPGAEPAAQPAAEATPASSQVTSARFIRNPDVLLVRGTYIRCVLETRIVTDIPGFTSCVVTEPVYSINGHQLLLPKGSKVLGKYDYEPTGPRVAVVWDRITTPNGIDVSMSSPGVDNLGGAGHEARYTAHWGSRITSALLISLISDAFKYAAAQNGPQTSSVGAGGVVVQSPYESATARTTERLANQALANRRPPTAIINQGTVLNIYVAKDVDFSSVIAQL